MSIMEEIFEIISCIEIFVNDIKTDTTDMFYMFYTVSQKSSTSYFAEYFRAGLTNCKNFNGYIVRDNLWTQICNQCFNF